MKHIEFRIFRQRKGSIRPIAMGAYHFLFPPSCSACRCPVSSPYALCADCWSTINFLTKPACTQCGMPQEYTTGEFCASCLIKPPRWQNFAAPFLYNKTIAGMIIQLKYADRFALLPFLLNALTQASYQLPNADYIIPVPLHPVRLWLRRFNQSAILAQRLAKNINSPEKYQPLWLHRHLKQWRKQKRLDPKQRWNNVKNSFYLSNKTPSFANKHIWLIDDVATTGATISAIAKLLQDHGASVSILVLARVEGAFPNLG